MNGRRTPESVKKTRAPSVKKTATNALKLYVFVNSAVFCGSVVAVVLSGVG